MLRLKYFATYFGVYTHDVSRRFLTANERVICRQCLRRCSTFLNLVTTTNNNTTPSSNAFRNYSRERAYKRIVQSNMQNEANCNGFNFLPSYYCYMPDPEPQTLTANYCKNIKLSDMNTSDCFFNRLMADDILSAEYISLSAEQLNNNEIIFLNDLLAPTIVNHLSLQSKISECTSSKKSDDECNKNQDDDKDKNEDDDKPSKDQLDIAEQVLIENFTKILSEKHDFSIYTKDIEFVNNWFQDKSYSTVGTMQYGLELAKLKLYVHVRLAHLKMTLLKVTNHIEDSSVKMRWRIIGIPHSKNLMKFFKDENKDSEYSNDDMAEWLDGFSTFYINKEGLVKKHVMDRVIPEDGDMVRPKQSMIEKLGLKMPLPIPS